MSGEGRGEGCSSAREWQVAVNTVSGEAGGVRGEVSAGENYARHGE